MVLKLSACQSFCLLGYYCLYCKDFQDQIPLKMFLLSNRSWELQFDLVVTVDLPWSNFRFFKIPDWDIDVAIIKSWCQKYYFTEFWQNVPVIKTNVIIIAISKHMWHGADYIISWTVKVPLYLADGLWAARHVVHCGTYSVHSATSKLSEVKYLLNELVWGFRLFPGWKGGWFCGTHNWRSLMLKWCRSELCSLPQ